jgi:predicted ribosome quality control (RQC) complex YloA/Tae2 family protein
VDDASIKIIVDELASLITGRSPGKIFQIGEATLVIDFGLRGDGYLLLNVEPSMPRLYLIKRRVRELEKLSRPLSSFGLTLRKELANTRLISVEKEPGDRVVWLTFTGEDDLSAGKTRKLVARLTGRSANLLLLDEHDRIASELRSSFSNEHRGQTYETSVKATSRHSKATDLLNAINSRDFPSASEAADHYFTSVIAAREMAARIASARADVRKKISRQESLLRQLEQDRTQHQGFEAQKRIGDLLLANLNTAKRNGRRVTLIDYFAEDAPTIEIEIDESISLQEEAARQFGLFSRSKRAIEHISRRLEQVQAALAKVSAEQESLETKIAAGEFPSPGTEASVPSSSTRDSNKRKGETKHIPGARRYLSSDGLEILVGRTANDNDRLTFKIAQPHDSWLHAADYGGSHVIVRNPTRKEVPQRTLIEAAQLAAFFSQAKKNPKADVHYTQRKFVSKIKGGKPGLVRLQRFKTIVVAPTESGTRI